MTCLNCIGYTRNRHGNLASEYRPEHPAASAGGWVGLCRILREEGRCQLDHGFIPLETVASQAPRAIRLTELPLRQAR